MVENPGDFGEILREQYKAKELVRIDFLNTIQLPLKLKGLKLASNKDFILGLPSSPCKSNIYSTL